MAEEWVWILVIFIILIIIIIAVAVWWSNSTTTTNPTPGTATTPTSWVWWIVGIIVFIIIIALIIWAVWPRRPAPVVHTVVTPPTPPPVVTPIVTPAPTPSPSTTTVMVGTPTEPTLATPPNVINHYYGHPGNVPPATLLPTAPPLEVPSAAPVVSQTSAQLGEQQFNEDPHQIVNVQPGYRARGIGPNGLPGTYTQPARVNTTMIDRPNAPTRTYLPGGPNSATAPGYGYRQVMVGNQPHYLVPSAAFST